MNAPLFLRLSSPSVFHSRRTLHIAGFSLQDLSATNIRSFRLGGYLMAKNSKRRAWTSVQVRELKTLAKKKTPAKKIAKSLKRTVGATRQKAFSMGLSLDSRG
jgi:hypothetical protein